MEALPILAIILGVAVPVLLVEGFLWIVFRARVRAIQLPDPSDLERLREGQLRYTRWLLLHGPVLSIALIAYLLVFW